MYSVQDILRIAVVNAVGDGRPPYTNINTVVQEKLVNNVVTAVLYEEIKEEIADG